MPANSNNENDAKESDPWWAVYWYASVVTLSIWMLVAIYGAVNYDLELKNARIVVRELSNQRIIGKPIYQIELWLVVVVVPISLAIVNGIVASLNRKRIKSS